MHVAIIMDGNGRWARERGLPRAQGHLAGAEAVRRAVEAARSAAITDLTLYAFSSDNWLRPPQEVEHLMRLFERFLVSEHQSCRNNGIRVRVIGRRDRLSVTLLRAICEAERLTASGTSLCLRIAVDYSARDLIVRAAENTPRSASRSSFAGLIASAAHCDQIPDVDLLIRTGREKRLSDFLLWESAYAELHFTDTMWPDFGAADLDEALAAFRNRARRFGAVEQTLCPAGQ